VQGFGEGGALSFVLLQLAGHFLLLRLFHAYGDINSLSLSTNAGVAVHVVFIAVTIDDHQVIIIYSHPLL